MRHVWICLVLAGCMVGPDYKRPEAPAPVAFKETAGWKISQPADATDGDRAPAEREDSRAALVGDPHELSAGAPAGHSREKIKPLSIFIRMHHPGRPGVRVDGQEQLAALVPGLHQDQRRTRR